MCIRDSYGEPYPTEEFLNDWLARTAEIILNYKPSLLYFDWWVQHQAFKPYLKKLAAFYYNCGVKWGKDVKICYKHDAMMFGSGIVEVERGGFAEAKPYDWQTDTAVARNSWCYTDTLDYKSSNAVSYTHLYVYKLGIGQGQIPLSTVIGMVKSVVSVTLLFAANGISKLIRGCLLYTSRCV